MRGIFTLLICFCLANTIHAQLIDSIEYFDWTGSSYSYAGHEIEKYTTNCKLDSDLVVKYFGINGQMEYTYLLTFTYNANRTQEIQYSWSNNNWLNQNRTTFIYNSNNKIDSVLKETWTNNMWQNQSLDIYSYDVNDFLVGVLTKDWQSQWKNNFNKIYTNNSDGNAVQVLEQDFNTSTNNWDTTGRLIYTYTTFKKIATYTAQTWKKNIWQNGNRSIYHYDSLHLTDI